MASQPGIGCPTDAGRCRALSRAAVKSGEQRHCSFISLAVSAPLPGQSRNSTSAARLLEYRKQDLPHQGAAPRYVQPVKFTWLRRAYHHRTGRRQNGGPLALLDRKSTTSEL